MEVGKKYSNTIQQADRKGNGKNSGKNNKKMAELAQNKFDVAVKAAEKIKTVSQIKEAEQTLFDADH